jgi:hypothetical protein
MFFHRLAKYDGVTEQKPSNGITVSWVVRVATRFYLSASCKFWVNLSSPFSFLNWFDERAWYPLGRIVGGTVYPGLMITSGAIHWFLTSLNIPVHIR